MSLKELVCGELTTQGLVLVRFTDLRDATGVLRDFGSNKAQCISLGDYHARRQGLSSELDGTNIFEGQVIVTLISNTRSAQFQEALLRRSIIETLEHFGDIMAFKTILAEAPRLILRVEFFDTKIAQTLLDKKISAMIAVRKRPLDFQTVTKNKRCAA